MSPASTPGVPSLLREINERQVLEVVREQHPVHRAEIARLTGLSKPTVSLALESLLHAGLVAESRSVRTGPGRVGVLFEPVADAAFILGIDVGARFVRAAVADLGGDVRGRADVLLARGRAKVTPARVVDAVANAVEQALQVAKTSKRKIAASAAGSPGVIDPVSGVQTITGTIPALDGVDLGSLLQATLGLPVAIENDVNMMALGEYAKGHGRGVEDFAVISVGTGLGAALVLHGELHRGHRGAAGEIDFIPFAQVGGEIDPAADGIIRSANRLAARNRRTALRAPYDPVEIFAAARDGDALGKAVVDVESRAIAVHVATLAAVLDIELVVLAGGIGRNGDLLLPLVHRHIAAMVPFPPRLEVSELGDDAVLLGALAVAHRDALNHVFVNRQLRERTTG